MRIMLIEDEEQDRELVQLACEAAAVEVDWRIAVDLACARAMLSAEARAAIEPPDLVLVDLVLPDGSGHDLLPELTAALPDTPAVVLSTSSNREDRERAKAAGALAYFVKPHRFADYLSIAAELPALAGRPA